LIQKKCILQNLREPDLIEDILASHDIWMFTLPAFMQEAS